MTTPFLHRPLGILDLDFASSLHANAFAPLGERGWTRQEIRELLATPGVAGFALLSDEKEVGFALCRIAADEAELLTVAVHDDHRRQGAGRALLKLTIALARQQGARHLFLEVGSDNPAALGLYLGMGFQPVGRRPGYYQRSGRPAADAVVMRLRLD
ncbi:MAG: ribosomal protein S18-alanine N-acetyltransferase [Alphaproteobacteria bacterium]|nr:ribosomal protein S18-alanine N-acetyltransferase [Alphaproteobacteria bacterium]